jgi:hypothetical protein
MRTSLLSAGVLLLVLMTTMVLPMARAAQLPTLLSAKKAGFRELADFGSLAVRFPATTLATTRGYIRRNREVVINFLRAEPKVRNT